MWTLAALVALVFGIVASVRLRALEGKASDLQRQLDAMDSEGPLYHALEELQDSLTTLKGDVGIWIEGTPISQSIEALQDRIGALETSMGASDLTTTLGESLSALEQRIESIERSIPSQVALLEERVASLKNQESPKAERAQLLRDPDSVQALERLVRQVAPLPLQRVYEFRLELADEFWTQRLRASPEEAAYVRDHGQKLVSLTIEEWTSHTIARATITPWSPDGEGLVERVTRIYPTDSDGWSDYYVLWDLPLSGMASSPDSGVFDVPPRLVLRLEDNILQLFGISGRFGRSSLLHRVDPRDENVFLRVPLGPGQLEKFQRPDESESEEPEPWHRYESAPWLACYRNQEAGTGISWELWVHDPQSLHDFNLNQETESSA